MQTDCLVNLFVEFLSTLHVMWRKPTTDALGL
jgi:hypothetical protein